MVGGLSRTAILRLLASSIRHHKRTHYHFHDLPARVISFEHMEECMNYGNLLFAMKKAYDDFDVREYVTAVHFYLIDDK